MKAPIPRGIIRAARVEEGVRPGTLNARTGGENMALVITKKSGAPPITKVAGERVIRTLIIMNRTIWVKFPASSTVKVESAVKKFNVVCDQKSWDGLRKIGEVLD
jgi:hypothetical protein